jgi:D-glycero-alpha-D-manno-heptose-7-phosphate kinase
LEECQSIDEITHPAIKATLKYVGYKARAGIFHASDLPARSGIGSSSAFVVGLLAAVRGGCWDCLASQAIDIEQNILGEPVGSQDQILCAKGGINQIVFHPMGHRGVREIGLSDERLKEFHSHLMLFYTSPRPYEPPQPLIWDIKQTRRLASMAKDGADLLFSDRDIKGFGDLLDDGWLIKRGMSDSISTEEIDNLYYMARRNGAIGGKLLGAGGGGFMLVFAEPHKHEGIRKALGLKQVPFEFDFEGCKVVYEG